MSNDKMEESEAGPSKPKKLKISINKNKCKKSPDNELMYGDEFSCEVNIKTEMDDSEYDSTDEENEEEASVMSGGKVPDWSTVRETIKTFPFSKTNKLLKNIPKNWTPIDYFRAILDDEFLNIIVEGTNFYAEDVLKLTIENTNKRSRVIKWKPVNNEEILKFIALVLHTGTIKLARLQDYWKGHPLFNLKCFSQHMSRDRFLSIMKCLYFCNYLTDDPDDTSTLYKIKPITDYFNNKMSELYYPGKDLCLPEPMLLSQGHILSCEEVKDKKQLRTSIKIHMLQEPNDIILKSLVSSGEMNNCNQGIISQGTKVVLDILDNYLDQGHSVYMDKTYSSYELAQCLTNRHTYCTGVLNPKKWYNPGVVINTKLKNGEKIAAFCDSIMVGKWKSKYDFLYISNEHRNEMVDYVDRKCRDQEKPAPLYFYSLIMGNLDNKDTLLSYYPCERKTLKWYQKLAVHYIQLMLINAYLFYRKYTKHNNITLYKFRLAVLEKILVGDVNTTTVPKIKVKERHIITKITDLNEKGETKRKRCKVCSKKKVRKMTLYHCEECPDIPGLCVGKCFEVFHKYIK